MPDAAGKFRGISVPELPWKRGECRTCGSDDPAADRIVQHEGDRILQETVYRPHDSLANPCPNPFHTGWMEAEDPDG